MDNVVKISLYEILRTISVCVHTEIFLKSSFLCFISSGESDVELDSLSESELLESDVEDAEELGF